MIRHTQRWKDLNCPQLFRYLEEKYINNFFENGELWITTLNTCRKHEETRRDEAEGVLDNIYLTTDNTGKAKLPDGMLYLVDKQDNPVGNAKVLLAKQLRNCYLLCMSSNDQLFQRFQCKYAIRIYEPERFLKDVFTAFKDKMEARVIRFSSVIYDDDHSKFDFTQHPWDAAFFKNTQFSREFEWRVCFVPKNSLSQIKSFNIYCPNSRRWCEKIACEQAR